MNTPRKMPRQKPGRSKQDYATPWPFIHAVEARFGKLYLDLAGDERNKKAPRVITATMDTFATRWPIDKRLWLNPPFGDIGRFAKRCADWLEVRKPNGFIYFLTPASIGANWFADHVWPWATVLALRPRMSFDGKDPYPKDCMLSVYGLPPRTLELWKWM